MTTDERTIGVDTHGERTYVAQVTHAAGRSLIEFLGDSIPSETEIATNGAKRHQVYGLSERDVIIKHIQVGKDDTYAAPQRARFELVQSLLDDEKNFSFDVVPSHAHDRFIGVAVRTSEMPKTVSPDQFQVRAIALANGFRTFCDHSHGDFHCVLDVTAYSISIVFLYQGLPARIGYMTRPEINHSEAACKALAGDLKTALSFHTNTLFHEGITVPLSQIHISADESDAPLVAALRQYSHGELRIPVLNQFSLGPDIAVPAEEQHRYLVALGLALE